ncbi:MAG: hypothetical protein JSV80_14230 [Acidobacteriota bacterium]|nr:MAG: hypothetical protein JSV80_14230 [Acidobacteriota bacterium]
MNGSKIIHVPDEGLGSAEEQARILAWLRPRVDTLLVPERQLRERVTTLAAEVFSDHASARSLTLIAVLKGAFMFTADLARGLWPWVAENGGPELQIEFVRSARFGERIKGAKDVASEVSIELLPADLSGRDVLLVEDLVDEGFTLLAVKRALVARGAGSVRICALLEKRLVDPSAQARAARAEARLDYVGFSVPDRWVAGYGIDAGEQLRALPSIVAVNESHYLKR